MAVTLGVQFKHKYMFPYFKQQLLHLLTQLHEARKAPFENIYKWCLIQEELIKKLSYIETKIRYNKNKIKQINYERKDPTIRLTKIESLRVKNRVSLLEYKIDEYNWLINIYKSIGDAVAFTFIDKFDIKPQNFKNSPGFITGKSGFKKEKQFFRLAYKEGAIAILNDLTSVLKYCDITLVSEDKFFLPIEIKSSENINDRVERQKSNAESLFKYLYEDVTNNLYGVEGAYKRVGICSPEINHVNTINELIEQSKNDGSAVRLVENGLLYIVQREETFEEAFFDQIYTQFKIKTPIVYLLNQMKFTEKGYYPFSISLSTPANYLDFLEGAFVIIILIDFNEIQMISAKKQFSIKLSNDIDFLFEFESLNNDAEIKQFKMSKHYFERIPIEFVSLRWQFEDMFKRIENKNP